MTATEQDHSLPDATVSIVGRGRLGYVTARALGAAGVIVHGPTARGEAVEPADAVLLCVPDDEIAVMAASISGASGLIGSLSGATPLSEAGVDFGMHPLQTFTGDEGPEAFHGIGCAIAGRSPAALELAQDLATLLGMQPFPIDDVDRAAYHTAASFASNFIVTLLAAAEELATTAGIAPTDSRALLSPLARSTVDNWATRGPISALTGPIARGDVRTVDRQRAAIVMAAPDLLVLFDALRSRTQNLAAIGREEKRDETWHADRT